MKRAVLLLLVVVGINPSAWGTITITPAEPTTSDEVCVTVSYLMPTGGYTMHVVGAWIAGPLIWLHLYWDCPRPGEMVTQAVVLHEHTEPLGRLDCGRYTVFAGAESRSFTVSAADPAAAPWPAWWPLFRGTFPW